MEFKNLVPLIRLAQSGDQKAMLELFLEFEPSILKYSRRYTNQINEDCYQELAVQFIIAVQSFDLSKYTDD
ncbi:helix-turn-helix domain-containing protein [Enterococcus gallinarum]|uniref:helix-turn-helix domain-containing protein n=1 Tax=Enterococcus gallinarum TaxID=1353 RepID=UPI0022E90C9F|nr:helix-turn-helix domain-containing protein [Enterococcus gallinarum]